MFPWAVELQGAATDCISIPFPPPPRSSGGLKRVKIGSLKLALFGGKEGNIDKYLFFFNKLWVRAGSEAQQ